MVGDRRPELRALVIEDSPLDAELTAAELRRGFSLEWERVDSEPALRAALARGGWELIIADFDLPTFNGLRALEIVRATGQDLPFLIVSGRIDQATAIAAMRSGAHDYFFKGDLDRLLPAVERELREAAERRGRRAAEAALRERYEELQTLLNILPIGICVAYDPAGNRMTINPAGARMLGISDQTNPSKNPPTGDQLPFRVFQNGVEVPPEALPIQYAATHDVSIRDADYDVVHADGTLVNLLEYAAPLHDERGQVRGAVGVFVDITQRRQYERQRHLLAEAGRVLSASLDVESRLSAVVRLPLPDLADWSLVYLASDGCWDLVAHAHADPQQEPLLAQLAGVLAPDPDRPGSVLGRVIRTGEPVFVASLPPDRYDHQPLSDEARQVARALNTCSLIAVPLRARGEVLGVLKVGYANASGRHYRAADVSLVEELGRRAAIAVDNARLFTATQRLNAELEQRVAERTAELQASREQLRRLTAWLETAREEERARVAYEVHDELGQQLTGLKMDIAWLQRRLGPDQPDLQARAADMGGLLDGAIRSVRRITATLRPSLLDDFGLPTVLEWQLQDFEARTGIQAQLHAAAGADVALTAEQITSLYRVVQEALANVQHHAGASLVVVRLERHGGEFRLSLRDNGRGLDQRRLLGSKTLGLVGMRERVQRLGGHLEFHGEPGKGTTLVVRLPLAAT